MSTELARGATLTERQAAILRAVVRRYIETSRPIGSGQVAEAAGLDVSSATIRKEMLLLEAEGYLHQPHTSAGRIPTDRGYRFFVDTVVAPDELGRADARLVREFFDQAHGELERLLGHTSSLLADLTHHTAVLIGPTADLDEVRSAQLVSLTPTLVMAVVVTASGRVDKHTVELEVELEEDLIQRAGSHLARELVGRVVGSTHQPRPSGDAVLDRLVERAMSGVVADSGESPIYLGGTSQIAETFDAIDTVRGVLAVLEKQLVVVSLVRDVLDRGLRVAIGTETGFETLNECSLVVSEYLVDGEPAGSIGLLGPTRMDYSQAMAAVAVVSRELGNRLSEG
jgi:heat-inducible transcriptional repressor